MKPKSIGPPSSWILWIIGIAITGLALPLEGAPEPRRAQADVAVRPEPAQFHASRVLVRFKQSASVAGGGAVRRIRANHRVVRPVRALSIWIWEIGPISPHTAKNGSTGQFVFIAPIRPHCCHPVLDGQLSPS